MNLSEFDLAVLAAIAFHQPISRDGLKDIFGKEISRDLIGRLAERDLIGTGPREPRRGAPYTFVTTETFLAAFGMESLRDLPDPEQLDDAGLAGPSEAIGHVRRPAGFDRRSADFMKPDRCPQQGGQIGLSGGGGPPQPGSFGKPIRERPDQPVVVFGGTGKPDPEGQRATASVASLTSICRSDSRRKKL